MTDSALADRLLALLHHPEYQPLDKGGLAKKLDLPEEDRPTLRRLLRQLEVHGKIARVRKDRYVLPEAAELITGVIQIHQSGSAHLLSQRPDQPDLFISAENTWTAMPGDTVVARLIHHPKGHRQMAARREGRVIRILERARDTIVGTLQRSHKFHYVVPDDPRFIHNVYVRTSETPLPKPPKVGDKVVVRLYEWEMRHINPEGEIIEVLGAADSPGVDMLSIVRKHALPTEFPAAVLAEAEAISETIAPEELHRREDLRQALIYTIDPDDARDFDDAIQVEVTADGWRLGVHIADVSHYVSPGTAMDKEAYHRGNSTYLPDRVIPMLPERLSNGICSLKPQVDRLTRSVFIDFTRGGKIKSARFTHSVIRSMARLTYKQAYAILTGKTPDPLPLTVPDRTEEIPQPVIDNLRLAWELASVLRKRRFDNGSLDLEFPEVKVWLDANGRPARLEKVENDISHQLIEEFMLAANEAVARETRRRAMPSVYRVHESPKEEKLLEFRDLVRLYGYKAGDLTQRAEVQRLLARMKGSAEEYALKINFLKSLRRAAYGVEPLGHYGLAKDDYTHFTSPIRRYADLVVHRVIGQIGKGQKVAASSLPDVAAHISVTERVSEDAEREAVKLKKIEFFALAAERQDRFQAVITEVRNYGFIVELPDYLVTGMVHISALQDDFYRYDPVRFRFTGRRNQFQAGDRIDVGVMKVDFFKQQIDFKPLEPLQGTASKSKQTTSKKPREAKKPKAKSKPARRPSGKRKR